MARKVKTSVEELKSWDEVDTALRKICECEIGIETIENDKKLAELDATEKAKKLSIPMKTAITVLEAQIEAFVEEHRDELDGKSRDMNFGTVGFRKSTRISYASAKTNEIITKLKQYKMTDCIHTDEKIKKESMKQYTDKELARVGVKRITEDNFYCETDREKIKG